jgi:hypothetical protein
MVVENNGMSIVAFFFVFFLYFSSIIFLLSPLYAGPPYAGLAHSRTLGVNWAMATR